VFEHLHDWFEEFELYHRKDTGIVKERDDLMAATRYGIMMLRYASVVARNERYSRPTRPHGRGSFMAA
jgi:hypothetical protein